MDLRFDNGYQFPSEIMMNMLSRCGTYDLLSMKMVSRNWFFSIKHSYFVRIHTEMGHNRVDPFLLLGARFVSAKKAYDRLITISSNADGEEILNYLRFHPYIEQNMSIELPGICNGLLCLKVTNNDEAVTFFICNPATRRVRQIEEFVLPMPTGHVKYDFGFNELSSSMYILVIYEDSNIVNQLKVMLYNCQSRTWTNINPPVVHTNIWESKSVCINSTIYWISYPTLGAAEQFPTVLRFDLAEQIFSTISGPTNRLVVSYIPVEFQGSLAIICAELQALELVRYITM
ncbi:F-box/kelch-repeat protein [Senna tora]|uniref:F-box/kelch-repeat protein n=1 Tax=Senna tora TaxID=362788 RepID=A0A834THB3_9FABA|nr:F-box/kelch-repeat protein [Senna tora]